MQDNTPYAEAAEINEDKLDETRSNEVHSRHVAHQQDPCSIQGPCPSKPFEGLEQCLSWHQQAWDYFSHACPCHRRRCASFQLEEQPQPRIVEGFASHRGYPILKPPRTTKQALTSVRDRVQDQEPYFGHDPYPGLTGIDRIPGVPPYSTGMDMRSGGTTSNTDRILGLLHEANTQSMGSDIRQRHPLGIPSTYSASRTLLGRDGQDSEGVMENRARPVIRGSQADPTIRRTTDHEDSRRLASGLPPNLSGTSGEGSGFGRQTDPGDRRTSNWRSSTWESHPNMGLASTYSPSTATERDATRNASRTLMTGLRRPGQHGVTAYDSAGHCREMRNPIERHSRGYGPNCYRRSTPQRATS